MAFEGRIGHIEGIESPWGNAGGVVKRIEEVERMAQTGVGWIEAGSYTLEPRPGNSPNLEEIYYHDPQTGETTNSLGMPNQGLDALIEEMPEMARIAHAHNKPLIVNVAPVSEDPATEVLEMVSRIEETEADGVLVNGGCPNVIVADGGRHELLSRNAPEFGRVLFTLAEDNPDRKVMVRVSPREDFDAGKKMYQMVVQSGVVSAVFTPNTWPGFAPTDAAGEHRLKVPGGVGGRSGPVMFEETAKELTGAWFGLYKEGIDYVASSSIMGAYALSKFVDRMGAVAGAGTTSFYEPKNGWAEDVDRLLNEYASITG